MRSVGEVEDGAPVLSPDAVPSNVIAEKGQPSHLGPLVANEEPVAAGGLCCHRRIDSNPFCM